MATWQKQITMDTRTKEGVTEWIETVHEAMTSVGCVQTDDTGQLDIDSYPDPDLGLGAGVAVPYGYRIYEMNDSLSATEPVYIKLEFVGKRHGVAGSLIGETLVTVGFSTDGAGNVSAPSATAFSQHNGYSSAGSQTIVPNAACYACKVDGFLFVCVGVAYSNHNGGYAHQTATVFAVSRHPDTSEVILYHLYNNPITGSAANYAEIAYTVTDRDREASVGPRVNAFRIPPVGTVDGAVVALPPVISGVRSVWADLNVACVRREVAPMNTTLSLSNDDLTEKKYLVLPTPTGQWDIQNRLEFVVDASQRYNAFMVVRWE